MTTVASHTLVATGAERVLLRLSRRVEAFALARLERRATLAAREIARLAHADDSRDRGAGVHVGLLPR